MVSKLTFRMTNIDTIRYVEKNLPAANSPVLWRSRNNVDVETNKDVETNPTPIHLTVPVKWIGVQKNDVKNLAGFLPTTNGFLGLRGKKSSGTSVINMSSYETYSLFRNLNYLWCSLGYHFYCFLKHLNLARNYLAPLT